MKKIILTALIATLAFVNVQAEEKTIAIDGLEFYIPEEWTEIKLDEKEDGSIYANYKTEWNQVIEFETVLYEPGNAEEIEELLSVKQNEISTWDDYYEVSTKRELLNDAKVLTTVFYVGEEIGYLESYDTGISVLNVWTIQPEEIDYDKSKIVVETITKPRKQKEVSEEKTDYTIKASEKDLIGATINSRISSTYKDTYIKQVTINPNMGDENKGGYIALVKLRWDTKNTEKTTLEMLKMYSDDLAATVADKQQEVKEIAVFWEVPYLDKNYKWSYVRKGDAMYLNDSAE